MIPKHIIELIKNFKNLHNEFNSETYKQLKNRIKLNFLSRKELSNYLNEQLKNIPLENKATLKADLKSDIRTNFKKYIVFLKKLYIYKILYEYLVEKFTPSDMQISKLNEFNEYKNFKNKSSVDIYNEIISLFKQKKEKFIKIHEELNSKQNFFNELNTHNLRELSSLNLSNENVQAFFIKHKLKNNGTNTNEEKQNFLKKIKSILNTRNRRVNNIEILNKSINNAKLRLNEIRKEIINKLETNSVINTRKIPNIKPLSNTRKNFAQVREGKNLNISKPFPNNNNE